MAVIDGEEFVALCTVQQSYLGVTGLVLLVFAFSLYVVSFFIKEEKTKKNLCKVAIILLGISVILALTYILAPIILKFLGFQPPPGEC